MDEEGGSKTMQIYNSTPVQYNSSLLYEANTASPTPTSFETTELETPIGYVDSIQKNHAPQDTSVNAIATTDTEEAARLLQESTNVPAQLKASLTDSESMFRKQDDGPTPLIVNGEDMKFKRFRTSSTLRWLTGVRLQWRILFYLIIGLAILLILYAAMNRESMSSTRIDELRAVLTTQHRVKIDVYMESQCPDTADFLDTQLMTTWTELKDYMDLKIYPFGKARWAKREPDDFTFQCQHGQNECLVNQLMCCGIEKLRTSDLYLPYIVCLQGTTLGDEDEAKCDRQAGLAHQEMQTCANSKHGRRLHQEMGNRTKSLNPPMYFVPWVLIEGKRDSSAVMDLKTVICKKLLIVGVKPAACTGIVANTAAPLAN